MLDPDVVSLDTSPFLEIVFFSIFFWFTVSRQLFLQLYIICFANLKGKKCLHRLEHKNSSAALRQILGGEENCKKVASRLSSLSVSEILNKKALSTPTVNLNMEIYLFFGSVYFSGIISDSSYKITLKTIRTFFPFLQSFSR